MPPSQRRVLALVCVVQFVDVASVNVALVSLPSIGAELGMGPAGLQWVITAYVLAFGGFLLLGGRLADLLGRRTLFSVGLGLFAAASLACGLAPSPAALIAARGLQGLGAALGAPAALAIITTSFSAGRERNRALGIWTAVAAAGGAGGLVIGGVLADLLGWRPVFLVLVPVAAVALALVPAVLPRTAATAPRGRLDAPGALAMTGGIVALLLALSLAGELGPAAAPTLASAALGAGLLLAFVAIERRAADPLVPLAVFAIRPLIGSGAVAAALTASTGAGAVVATLYLQGVLGHSPTVAGLAALPFSVAVVAGSLAGAPIAARLGHRRAMAGGLGVVAGGALCALPITAQGGLGWILAEATVAGAGLGIASVASTARGTAAVGEGQRGLASGLLTSAAQIGTAIGLAVLLTAAASRSRALAGAAPAADALVAGYRWAFAGAALIAALGVLAALALTAGAPASAPSRRRSGAARAGR